jgi:hypothetical protein
MLALEKQTGQFQNFNLRPEKHGDENVPGADLKIQITASNDILSEFHPSLKASLYRAPHPGEMDMVDQAEAEEGQPPALTRLAFGNKLHGFKLDDEIVGAAFTVHYGTGGKSDIELEDCTVDSFTIEPLDGGSCSVSFRVKCNPDEKAVGKLSRLMGNEIEFTLRPPEAPEMREAA